MPCDLRSVCMYHSVAGICPAVCMYHSVAGICPVIYGLFVCIIVWLVYAL